MIYGFEKSVERINDGVKSLWLCQTKRELEETCEYLQEYCGNVKYETLTAECSTIHVLETLLKYKTGKISLIIATNIAAQGINLDCENLIIEDQRGYGDKSLLRQKFGRLGRYGITREDSELTYCLLNDNHSCLTEKLEFRHNKFVYEDGYENYYMPPSYTKEEIAKKLFLY